MTSADPPNSSRLLRAAGTTLLALAALCLVVGVVSLVGGGSSPRGGSAAPSGSSQPAVPGAASPTTGRPNVTNQPTATAVPSQSQPVGTITTSTSKPPPTQAQSLPLRVYNNSTIAGLAARAADDLRNAGWNVAEVGNYGSGVIATTTVYFRPGTDEEGPAKQLAAQFQMRAEPRFEGIANAPAGVVVIVTNDYKGLRNK